MPGQRNITELLTANLNGGSTSSRTKVQKAEPSTTFMMQAVFWQSRLDLAPQKPSCEPKGRQWVRIAGNARSIEVFWNRLPPCVVRMLSETNTFYRRMVSSLAGSVLGCVRGAHTQQQFRLECCPGLQLKDDDDQKLHEKKVQMMGMHDRPMLLSQTKPVQKYAWLSFSPVSYCCSRLVFVVPHGPFLGTLPPVSITPLLALLQWGGQPAIWCQESAATPVPRLENEPLSYK